MAAPSLSIHIDCERTTLVDKIVGILRRRLAERGVDLRDSPATAAALLLDITPDIGTEGYRIEDAGPQAVRVLGNDERGLLYGVGKFLRDGRLTAGAFVPGPWRGTSVPQGEVRGIYFASHFFNTYHVGPTGITERLIEDLALWGCNALAVWFDMHHFNGLDDPRAQAMIERLKVFLRCAVEVGMGPGLVMLANEAYANSPEALRGTCHGSYGVELCPAKPGAMQWLCEQRREMLEAFAEVDLQYAIIWPYDQGGCDCPDCSPWGANGFLRTAEAVAGVAREVFPKVQRVLSTWWFDNHYSGEWTGLAKAFAQRPDWVDYLMADADGTRFPAHPLIHGVPGGLPLIGFPEISMYRMYPWGGYGANPLPSRLQCIWDEVSHRMVGGFPYSEGIYEDLNKAIELQFYWNPRRTAMETVREYIAGEFGPEQVEELTCAIELLEAGHPRLWQADPESGAPVAQLAHPEHAAECFARFQRADAAMPDALRGQWRWRILYLRAAIDAALALSDGRVTPSIDEHLAELTAIYAMPAAARHAPINKTIQSQVMGGMHAEVWDVG